MLISDEKLLDLGDIRRLNTWHSDQLFHVMTCSSVTKHNRVVWWHIDRTQNFAPPQAYDASLARMQLVAILIMKAYLEFPQYMTSPAAFNLVLHILYICISNL